MRSSRFKRPEQPTTPLVLTLRDYRVFAYLRDYGLLTTRHLQAFCFPDTALRRVQYRLRQLWVHQLLDRSFRPVVFDGTKPFQLDIAYCLGPRAAELVVDGAPLRAFKTPSPITFEHELAVADCLSAITAACRGRLDVSLVSAVPAAPLWRAFRPQSADLFRVPDGAVTLRRPRGDVRTFYIEIVRADVRGGNGSLLRKMQEYVQLNRAGRLRERYGHEQLRAVLFLTTSDERAGHFQQLAATLPHGRRLFWFGTYQETDEDGRTVPCVTPATVMDARWTTAEGEAVSFLSP